MALIRVRVIVLMVIWIVLLILSLVFLSALTSFLSSPQYRSISSESWAGYIVSKDYFNYPAEVTGVSASWHVPKISTFGGDGDSSTWIGIGGQSDKTLIQVGTEQDVRNGQESYDVWYELLPDYAIIISDVSISPGDSIDASITLADATTNQWRIEVKNNDNGQNFAVDFNYNSTRSSGEWIIERPTLRTNQVSDLANFQWVTFSNCEMAVNNTTNSLSNYPYSGIQMRDDLDRSLATISQLISASNSFTVTYQANQ